MSRGYSVVLAGSFGSYLTSSVITGAGGVNRIRYDSIRLPVYLRLPDFKAFSTSLRNGRCGLPMVANTFRTAERLTLLSLAIRQTC